MIRVERPARFGPRVRWLASAFDRSWGITGPQPIHADAATTVAFIEQIPDEILLHPVASTRFFIDWRPMLPNDMWFLNPRMHSCIQNGLIRMDESDNIHYIRWTASRIWRHSTVQRQRVFHGCVCANNMLQTPDPSGTSVRAVQNGYDAIFAFVIGRLPVSLQAEFNKPSSRLNSVSRHGLQQQVRVPGLKQTEIG